MKSLFVVFYGYDDKAMERKIYKCSYSHMISYAKKHGGKIGAKYFWQFQPLRRYDIFDFKEDD